MIAPGTEPGLWQTARALAGRDLRLLWRRRGDALQPLLFALLVVVLFALALGRDPPLMAQVAAAVLWLAVLLAGQLSLDSLFRSDAEDGSLEQWLLAPVPLAWLVLVRVLVHWATTALPMIVVAPLLAEMLHLPHDQLPILLASLLLGTPLLSLIGGVVAALTVSIRRSGILVALLALPLFVPVLVFGAGSVAAAARGQDPVGALLLLGAGLVVALVLAPLATAAAIRISLS
ncbi:MULTISPECIES: heme exporter protein CcmB [unclassified Stenotrophomonas]|jgi:heme exporter protein B|uniref:heme exporter protein CcmB n=1 Tax=unclassified Stenotrophomonas TaxID=196198 RepID=UPI001C30E5E0|nr:MULTISPECIES: heme exporter protein CcmB [unclassified Stenotrophomonas]MDQ1062171.1 heme exporter protein B [Stenotrophomonas sp. SORGH_AS_0282]MDQ1189474.1 heme exporter protein B [Stenotrophomonas sp. SORGH_AS_0282]MDY0978816.1 heme exporter protein CcmB [Stenotrophomonas sp. CFBP8994]